MRIGIDFATQRAAQDVIDRYPVNSSVKINYNPDTPSQGVLEVEDPEFYWHWFVVAFFAIGGAVLSYNMGTFRFLIGR